MFFEDFPHAVTVESLTATQDAAGGNDEAFATRSAGVACLITQQRGTLAPAFDQPHRVVSHTVATTYAGTRPGDRLLVTSGPPNTAAKYLRVLGIAGNGPAGDVGEWVDLYCSQEL